VVSLPEMLRVLNFGFSILDFVDHHELTKIDVDGCIGATAGAAACSMQKGKQVQLSFDFVSNQDTSKVNFGWSANVGGVDIPVPGIETDACKHLSCPLVKGQKYVFTFQMVIPTLLPNIKADNTYTLKGDQGVIACGVLEGEIHS